MKFNEKRVKKLNELLNEVRDNREEFIEIVKNMCPKDITECDNQLEENRDAVSCEYFTLCNVLGSYSLMTDEQKEKINEVLDMVYSEVDHRRNKVNEFYL